jgi:hypothetical protein
VARDIDTDASLDGRGGGANERDEYGPELTWRAFGCHCRYRCVYTK